MRCRLLLLFFLLSCLNVWSQNPATVFSIPNRNLTLPCGTNCTTITATVPHIKESNDYLITNMPYLPFAYTTATGTEAIELYADDRWGPKISLPFGFCFYGITYPTLLMGSNSNITFDTSRESDPSGYVITTGTPIPNSSSANVYAKASIFGPYHDINPSNTNNPAPTNRKIEWRVEGVAPKRRFIASYNDVAYFGTDCNTNKATHQMVLYESTGIIEVYIQDKPVCTDWNSGLAILGVQDETRTRAVAATGKNATTWGTVGMNEGYRFIPSAGTPKFKRAELLINNSVVSVADTASGTPGNLNLSFPNVCPTLDSTAYIMKVTYGSCSDPSQDVSFFDTVFIKRPVPGITITTQDANCATGGTITANLSGGNNTFEFSLNGGTPQTSNVFSNLPAGNYTISARNGVCAASSQASIALVNNLTLNALPGDTTICQGASFLPRVSTNATSYSWTPSSSVNPVTALQPILSPSGSSMKFILTASQGPCVITDTINVTVFQSTPVNAGPDLTIISGDIVQLQATGTTGSTYVWTPSTALSATNILRPNANPTQTITYTLTQTTGQGCTSSDNVTVTVLNCVDPMTAFTPNGDGINDLWLVTNNSCLKTARVDVYNRYGAKVYENASYSNNWDGTYKGKPLPDGTYYFVVTYTLINGKPVQMKGNVTILR